MARPREFEYETALQGAMDIFWQQGYRATNLPDLLQAMGLTRGSFYQAFGDKEATYLQALDFYDACVVSKTVDMLNQCNADDATACLLPLFQPNGKEARGCFICNAMVELGSENRRAAEKANAMAGRLRAAILGVLTRCGEGRGERSPSDTADLMLHLYFGKQAMGKAGGSSNDWEARLRSLL
ncbi:TetR family transcriptional regulator [Roseobacter cerasinus]|uniref:TetR family transcriptional regulator n=1 Tax=Roseobacter cerasinus TaxID=2602289 RepID=A0A640VRI5_9RHOB|nr:TetR/AcrR family transcriptional regulator [Roseobacter cerasinus]GFE49711.1 TetR family transcriptional regulator [Roseobacter cerasinus]